MQQVFEGCLQQLGFSRFFPLPKYTKETPSFVSPVSAARGKQTLRAFSAHPVIGTHAPSCSVFYFDYDNYKFRTHCQQLAFLL